jgi:hypothetical protein
LRIEVGVAVAVDVLEDHISLAPHHDSKTRTTRPGEIFEAALSSHVLDNCCVEGRVAGLVLCLRRAPSECERMD